MQSFVRVLEGVNDGKAGAPVQRTLASSSFPPLFSAANTLCSPCDHKSHQASNDSPLNDYEEAKDIGAVGTPLFSESNEDRWQV